MTMCDVIIISAIS